MMNGTLCSAEMDVFTNGVFVARKDAKEEADGKAQRRHRDPERHIDRKLSLFGIEGVRNDQEDGRDEGQESENGDCNCWG